MVELVLDNVKKLLNIAVDLQDCWRIVRENVFPRWRRLETSDISCFKYAPFFSVNVEKSFSIQEFLLAKNHQSFECENFQKVFVAYCNAVLGDNNSEVDKLSIIIMIKCKEVDKWR